MDPLEAFIMAERRQRTLEQTILVNRSRNLFLKPEIQCASLNSEAVILFINFYNYKDILTQIQTTLKYNDITVEGDGSSHCALGKALNQSLPVLECIWRYVRWYWWKCCEFKWRNYVTLGKVRLLLVSGKSSGKCALFILSHYLLFVISFLLSNIYTVFMCFLVSVWNVSQIFVKMLYHTVLTECFTVIDNISLIIFV